jgi:hypothetical protein
MWIRFFVLIKSVETQNDFGDSLVLTGKTEKLSAFSSDRLAICPTGSCRRATRPTEHPSSKMTKVIIADI